MANTTPVWSPEGYIGLPQNTPVPPCELRDVRNSVLRLPASKRLIAGGSLLVGDAAVAAAKKANKIKVKAEEEADTESPKVEEPENDQNDDVESSEEPEETEEAEESKEPEEPETEEEEPEEKPKKKKSKKKKNRRGRSK